MGQKKYKAVIFGNKLYREVSLPETINNAVCIGTTSKCVGAAKLDRQKFNNRDFEIAVFCGEGIGFAVKSLVGYESLDKIVVCHNDSFFVNDLID